MKFGLFSLMTQREPNGTGTIVSDTKEMVRLAEACGFEIAWFAEHHFSNYSVSPSPLLLAGYFAGVTSKIKLGTGVIVLPLYHPVRLMEEMGIVDTLSEGRLVVGIGTGYQSFEFNRMGVPFDEKVERSLELIDIMETALATGRLSSEGRHYRLPDLPLCARMLNARRPEIYIASSQPELIDKATANGYVPFVTVGYRNVDALLERRMSFESSYSRRGVPAEQMPFAVQRYVYVTEDYRDALDAAAQILYVNRLGSSLRGDSQELDGPMLRPLPFRGEATPEQILADAIIGDPDHCAERLIDEVRRVRASHFSCFMQFGQMDGRRALRSMERFAAEVMPRVEKTLAYGGAAPSVPAAVSAR